MKTAIVTGPAVYPITVEEFTAFARVDSTAEDVLISALIGMATAHVENIAWRKLITQTWRVYFDYFSGEVIHLPFGSLQSVSSVKYTDTDEAEHTVSADLYSVDAVGEPGSVFLKDGQSWPDADLQPVNGVCIEFVCGYGDAEDVPEAIKTAIKLMAAHLYENREIINFSSFDLNEIPQSFNALLANYRLKRF